jgi:YVTN family beta-propeller protein
MPNFNPTLSVLASHVTRLTFCLVLLAGPAYGYVIQTVETFRSTQKLHLPVSEVNPSSPFWMDVDSFPFPSTDVERIVRASFGAWEDVGTSYLRFSEEGGGTFQGARSDGRNSIIYDADGTDLEIPSGTGIIAITRTYWDGNGNISEADIIFNGREIDFSVNQNSTRFGQVDLQNTMTHEVGHLLGLDHSPLVGPSTSRPTMNPFNDPSGPREGRTLELDDRAAISVLYPAASATSLGRISGHVTHPGGAGAFGVHVVAYRAGTTSFVVSMLTGATSDGAYEIGGLPAGDYQLRIEPLDGDVNHESFGGVYGEPFDSDFEAEFYDNVVNQSNAPVISLRSGDSLDGFDFVLGPAGTLPPAVIAADLPVSSPDATGPYPVSVTASDDGDIVSVNLVYVVDGGLAHVVDMTFGNGTYTAAIPGQMAASRITYRVVAIDDEGLTTALPASGDFEFDIIDFSGEPVLYVATRNDGAISVIDTGPGSEVARIPVGDTPLSVVLSPDGRHLFVANSGANNGTEGDGVWVIDTDTHQTVARIPTGTGPLDMDLSSDGRSVYVTNSQEGSVSVINVPGRSLTRTLPNVTFGAGPYGVADTPSGRLFVTDLNDNSVLEVDPITGSVLLSVPVVASPRSLAVSPKGDRIYVAGFEGGISVLSPVTGDVVLTYDTGSAERLFRVALSPSGDTLYASDPTNAELLVFTQDVLADIVTGPVGSENTRDVAVSEDGQRVYLSNQDSNELLVIDGVSGEVVSVVAVPGGPRGIAVRSDPLGVSFDVNLAVRSDFDGSGDVAFSDFLLFASAFGLSLSDAGFDARFDLDSDSQVGFSDFLLFASTFGYAVG